MINDKRFQIVDGETERMQFVTLLTFCNQVNVSLVIIG